jgi:hypothetical protein
MPAAAALAWFQAWGRAARFAFTVAAAALSPSTYTPRLLATAVKQLYFTVWQVFLGFTMFSALLSAVVIEITIQAARGYGLGTYALELVFRVLVLETLPLFSSPCAPARRSARRSR